MIFRIFQGYKVELHLYIIKKLKKIMVKKLSLGLALLSGVVLVSCSNEMDLKSEQGHGNLELAFSFESPNLTRAVSTAKPTTNWADIKNVDVFFCDPVTNNIITVKQIDGAKFAPGAIGTPQKIMFKDIKAQTYNIYAFANASDAGMVPTPAKAGAAPLWSTGAVEGKNIDDVYMMLKAAGQEQVGSTQQSLYNKAVNLFEATPVVGGNGTANPINIQSGKDVQINLPLKRQVSLLRIRINKNGYQTSFTDPASFVKVMDNPLQVSALGSRLSSFVNKAVIKETAAFSIQNPTNGYNGGTIVDAENTEWIDITIPAASRKGATDGFKRPYIVLKGKKGDEYRYYGFYLPLVATNGSVWTYTKENTIYDLSVKLTSDGSTIEPEIPTPVGNVDLNVSVVDWGNIEEYQTEI